MEHWRNINLNKYLNKEVVVDGVRFQSKHEATRWCELKYMERAGLIYDLQRQVPLAPIYPREVSAAKGWSEEENNQFRAHAPAYKRRAEK